MMTWYYIGAALLGVIFVGAGLKLWWSDPGRSAYEAWVRPGGRGLGNLE